MDFHYSYILLDSVGNRRKESCDLHEFVPPLLCEVAKIGCAVTNRQARTDYLYRDD